jgi:uncharacterized protein YndB with AHSA1/START domain
MATARATRRIAAAPAALWNVVADPYALPRWWPRVARVESVTNRAFTQVLQTPRGRQVRADFRVTEQDQGRRRVWSQEIEDSPFAKHFSSVVIELRLAPRGVAETDVVLEQRTQMRGVSRFGGWLANRAVRRTLREALATLDEQVGSE